MMIRTRAAIVVAACLFASLPERVSFDSVSPNYHYTMGYISPGGMLASDALPLTLPLSGTTTARWSVYDFGPQVIGNITSYSSAPVPEPGAVAGPVLSVMFIRRPKRSQPAAS